MDGAFQATYLYNTIDDHGWADDLDILGVSISTPYAHKRLLAERAPTASGSSPTPART